MMPHDPRLTHDPVAHLLTRAAPAMEWWEHTAVIDDLTDQVIGWIVYDTPDSAPNDVKRGFTARRLAVANGHCECGAEMVWHRPDGTLAPYVDHFPSCPGHLEVLGEAIEQWERGTKL